MTASCMRSLSSVVECVLLINYYCNQDDNVIIDWHFLDIYIQKLECMWVGVRLPTADIYTYIFLCVLLSHF